MTPDQPRFGWLRGARYRTWSKLLHRFDLHYAPVSGPIEPGGEYQRWCQWCGFRQSFSRGTTP